MGVGRDIKFQRDFPLRPGIVEVVSSGVRRILCDNPGPFTFTGTVTYILGSGRVAIIDPGPDNEAHSNAILAALAGEEISHILVTHTHLDHSANTQRLKAATGAVVLANDAALKPRLIADNGVQSFEAIGDGMFRADVRLSDGDVVAEDSWALQAIATPGHASNHMAFGWPDRDMLFCGDVVMGWSTTNVSPPDGSMADYMASLDMLLLRSEDLYFPAHGPEIRNARSFVGDLKRHRQMREASIMKYLARGPSDIATIVRDTYRTISSDLLPAARRTVFAHLEYLVARGLVATDGTPSLTCIYRRVTNLA